MAGVLDGLLVLEWAEGIAGPYCGKLLGDFGAKVVKLELPGTGDPSRYWGPFRDGRPDPNGSGLFLHLNTGKRSVELDPATSEGQERFLRLFRRCDVLIEDRTAAQKAGAGLDEPVLREQNPGAVLTSVTSFGLNGPYRDYLADELIIYHLAAHAYATPNQVRDPAQHPPLRTGGMDSEVLGGTFGAVGTMLALFRRNRGGLGGQVEVSAFEALSSFNRVSLAYLTYQGLMTSRLAGSRMITAPMGFIPCKNGHVNVHCADNGHWERFKAVMGNPDWAESELLATRESRGEYWDAFDPLVREWAAGFTKEELYRLFQDNGVCCFPYFDMADVRSYEQLALRRYFQSVHHPVAGDVVHPGPPFQLPETPVRLQPAPRLGEHNGGAWGLGVDGWESKGDTTAHASPVSLSPQGGAHTDSAAFPVSLSPSGGEGSSPLTGIRILDLTWVVAGPLACQIMAQMGADVIKLESRKKLDIHRHSEPYADGKRGPETGGYFHSLHAAKRSVTIDISVPSGQRLLDRLVSKCDVVLEGMSWRAATKLGLTYERFAHANPRVICVSIAGLGRTEPHGGYLTYGPQLMALAGWNSLTGYPDEPPSLGGGQFTDQLVGIYAILAVLLALRHRERTGRGQHVDLSMLECLGNVVANGLVEFDVAGRVPVPHGNAAPWASPYGAYPCRGEDRWAAIAVRTDEEWRRLCRVAGHPEWAEDPRFATAVNRIEHRGEVDAVVAAWAVEHDPDEVMNTLQAAGVPAARTSMACDLLTDPHLRARKFFVARPHPFAGERELSDVPFRIDGVRAFNNDRSPLLGEHTEDVLGGLLGLSEEEIAGFRADGVLQ